MTYELAKQLKNAGFPQKTEMLASSDTLSSSDNWSVYMLGIYTTGRHITQDFDKPRPSARFTEAYHFSDEGREKTVYVPTLSELIESCKGGNKRFSLQHYMGTGHHWEAIIASSKGIGSTPEEAVAHLYLKLHE